MDKGNQTAERLKLATEAAGIGIWDWDIVKNKLVWDDRMYKLYGLDPGDFGGAYEAWLQGLHPEDREAAYAVSQKAVHEDAAYDTEFRIVWPDGSVRWLKASGRVFRDRRGPVRMLGVNYDITERKKSEVEIATLKRLYATLSQVNQAIVRIREEESLFRTICDVAVEFGGFNLVWIGLLDAASGDIRPVASRGIPLESWPFPVINLHQGPVSRALTAQSLQLGKVVVTEDLQKNEVAAPILKEKGFNDYRAQAVVPLFRQGRPVGVLGLISPEPGFFGDQKEIRLLDEMGLDISYALDQIEKDRLLQQWADAFENCAHGIAIGLPGSNKILTCNAAFARLQGRTPEEITGMPITEMYDPEFREYVKKSIAVSDLLGSVQYEARMIRRDGSSYPVQMDVVSVRDEKGTIVYRVDTQQDITERKRAEQEILTRERILKLFVEYTPAAIAMFDRNMRYLAVSRRFAEDYRLQVSDFIGKSHYEIFPEIPERWREIHRRCLAGAVEKAEEDPFPRADGTTDWVHWEIHPWFEKEHEIGGILLFSEVITDRIRAREEVLNLNLELESRVAHRTMMLQDANQELEAFSFSVSHDLRAPLRAVMGFSSILKEEYGRSLDAEGNRLCDVIISSAANMGRLIDELLAFSRLGKSEIYPAPVQMRAVVQAVFEELAAGEDKGRITLKVDDLPETPADPAMIRQVWTNLISNAIKYSGRKKQARIEISCTVEPGKHIYCIRDNGIGFDMKYAGKLFGVFQRLHSNFEFEGTGVGLAIVQRIIQKHGGKIWAESKPGAGAAFWFTLPV